jgi:enoyl-CoA hydratase/carnithine racemase
MSDLLQVTRQERLLRIALNRPEKRNALNVTLCRELVSALEHADADRGIGAVLLTGNGKSFCAGMDLSEVLSADAAEIHRVQEQLFTVGVRLTKPIVAAVHGAALAGGTGLVANCHIVIAATDAVFGLTEIHVGLWPFLIFRSVAHAVGERRTVELALTGRTFNAPEAREAGLVHEITSPDSLAERAAEIALSIAGACPTALRSGLMFVREVRGRTWEDAREIARQVREQVFRSPDFKEGIEAFLEKRPPHWPTIR